jgi:hypothetical protein
LIDEASVKQEIYQKSSDIESLLFLFVVHDSTPALRREWEGTAHNRAEEVWAFFVEGAQG